MNRDQRLYELIQLLRDGKLHTASELAEQMQVSTRTIWRDMAMMAATGLPIEGERGLGYILRTPLVLPPTVLTPEEAEALGEALRAFASDPAHPRVRPARSLLSKLATLLPQARFGPTNFPPLPSQPQGQPQAQPHSEAVAPLAKPARLS